VSGDGEPRRTRSAPERVAVSLSRGERAALRELGQRRCEPEATTAARLVRAGLADAGAALDEPPQRRRGPNAGRARAQDPSEAATAPWLPTSARRAAILALRERYPYELRLAPEDLETDRLAAERLAALSVWRDELDVGLHRDPRMELAFGAELAAVARWLEERSRRRR
jgi:hypothetical protein